jgi:hypothetical protein
VFLTLLQGPKGLPGGGAASQVIATFQLEVKTPYYASKTGNCASHKILVFLALMHGFRQNAEVIMESTKYVAIGRWMGANGGWPSALCA